MNDPIDSADQIDLSVMSVQVTHEFGARIDVVWALLTDFERMAGLGPEHRSANWIRRENGDHPTNGDGPVVGDRFTGTNRRGDFEWNVVCHITEWQPPQRCSFTVLDPERPSSTWTYVLTATEDRTSVVQLFRHGPGPSFVRSSVERDPSSAESIIRGRSEMLRNNMADTLAAADRLLAGDTST